MKFRVTIEAEAEADSLRDLLDDIAGGIAPQPVTNTMALFLGPVGPRSDLTAPRSSDMADPVRLMQMQEFTATIGGIKDAQGREAALDGVPGWVSSDASIVDVRPADDGMSALVGSLGIDGAATITATADGRAGEEVLPVIAVMSVVVAPGDAVVFEITAGEVTDRAEAPEPEPAPVEPLPPE